MTTPLLEGTDGVEKMSKSLGNYVGVTEAPDDDVRASSCRISDELMWQYYLLLTDLTPGADRGRSRRGRSHGLEARAGAPASSPTSTARRPRGAAEAEWRRVHQERQAPPDMPRVTVARRRATSRASSWSRPASRRRRARPSGSCASGAVKRDGVVVEAERSSSSPGQASRSSLSVGAAPVRPRRRRERFDGSETGRRRDSVCLSSRRGCYCERVRRVVGHWPVVPTPEGPLKDRSNGARKVA